LERMWKEVAVLKLGDSPGNFLEELRKTTKNLSHNSR
jgi:hypothetical protein